MKALTIRQPWASLIAAGVKTIETRSWPTKHRGPVAIHAGARSATLDEAWPAWKATDLDSWSIEVTRYPSRDNDTANPLPLGAVVATAVLTDCVPMVHPGEEGGIRTLDVDDNGSLWLVEAERYPGIPDVAVTLRSEYLSDGSLDHPDPAVWEEWCEQRGIFPSREWAEVSDQAPFGDFAPGRWAWLLADVEVLAEPVPARGRQGLWNWEPTT